MVYWLAHDKIESIKSRRFLYQIWWSPMEIVEVKYRGLYISSDLTRDAQIYFICKQMRFTMLLLSRLSNLGWAYIFSLFLNNSSPWRIV